MQFGVTFDRWSTLQPRLPDTVDEMSTSTHVSTYFRTKEKNGFILYLGNPKDTMLRRTKSVSYNIKVVFCYRKHLVDFFFITKVKVEIKSIKTTYMLPFIIFQDDFMVIGIQNGYPYVVMDIGDNAEAGKEPTKISSDKFVADSKWYQVIVDR